ncbi:hypothetical protein GCM10010339_52810 [Streptomyces alanosinicus]|uniref:Uncharacterized protein n=1 Tax=Streptomyces alanosinicus TaxID=68171 RepID=A0A918YLR7_9ACTN|nr:hypothetical protein GCM10010339_52810 [Streptomyces alanosinicus]
MQITGVHQKSGVGEGLHRARRGPGLGGVRPGARERGDPASERAGRRESPAEREEPPSAQTVLVDVLVGRAAHAGTPWARRR